MKPDARKMIEEVKSQIMRTIRRVTDVPVSEQEKFEAMLACEQYSKGEIFIQTGQVPQKFGFASKGLFRYHYLDGKGNDFTKGFFAEGSFISSYSSMISETGSYYTIEALEDAEVIVIHYSDWKNLLKGHCCWSKFLLSQIEKGYMKKEAREREFLLLDAEERYRSFLKGYPGLDKRIKQHLVASYLGITPVALSRIRNKMGLVNIG